MNAATRGRLRSLLESPIESLRSIGGGNVASAFEVRLVDGRRLFVKDYGDAPQALASCEANGLSWLAAADAIELPRVVACDSVSPILVLEWIEPAKPAADFDEMLGRNLAQLHAHGAEGFGLETDNFIGPLPQLNMRGSNWPHFYAESRLRPLLRRAFDTEALSGTVVRDAEKILERLDELCGPPEPPARLHGDLWRGNLMVGAAGQPLLIDPAVYAGHREMDLAMMKLFGGFATRAFDAYDEQAPLSPGAGERVALYQLYPLLVHVVLFGGGYAADFERALRRYR